MPKDNIDIETQKFGNAWLIFSVFFLLLLLVLWFTTKNDFWTGIVAFTVSSLLVITYCLQLGFKREKEKKEKI